MISSARSLKTIFILSLTALFLIAVNGCGPKPEEVAFKKGVDYITKGMYDEAIIELSKAIEINPAYAEAYGKRGFMYRKKGNLDQAIAGYTKAIEINPNFAVAYAARAKTYFLKQEYDKSWEDLHKAEALGYDITKAEFLEELKKASGREK